MVTANHSARLLRSVVSDVCAVVRVVMGADVAETALFDGKGDAPTYTARHFVFTSLHDCYGWSYSDISASCGVTKRKVIKAVGKVRTLRGIDGLYSAIANELKMLGYEL